MLIYCKLFVLLCTPHCVCQTSLILARMYGRFTQRQKRKICKSPLKWVIVYLIKRMRMCNCLRSLEMKIMISWQVFPPSLTMLNFMMYCLCFLSITNRILLLLMLINRNIKMYNIIVFSLILDTSYYYWESSVWNTW